MNGENIIPKITDKRGMLWKQPHRRYIEIDEEYALMTKQTFEGLKETIDYQDRQKLKRSGRN